MYLNIIFNDIMFTINKLHKKRKTKFAANMLVGEDFTKIVLEFNGLIIQEPNALITDLLMGSMSIFFALRLRKRKSEHSFFKILVLFLF